MLLRNITPKPISQLWASHWVQERNPGAREVKKVFLYFGLSFLFLLCCMTGSMCGGMTSGSVLAKLGCSPVLVPARPVCAIAACSCTAKSSACYVHTEMEVVLSEGSRQMPCLSTSRPKSHSGKSLVSTQEGLFPFLRLDFPLHMAAVLAQPLPALALTSAGLFVYELLYGSQGCRMFLTTPLWGWDVFVILVLQDKNWEPDVLVWESSQAVAVLPGVTPKYWGVPWRGGQEATGAHQPWQPQLA